MMPKVKRKSATWSDQSPQLEVIPSVDAPSSEHPASVTHPFAPASPLAPTSTPADQAPTTPGSGADGVSLPFLRLKYSRRLAYDGEDG